MTSEGTLSWKATVPTINCPCCHEDRDVAAETQLPMLEAAIREHNGDPWRREPGWVIAQIRSHEILQWACQQCLSSGRAIAGQPWLQQWSDFPPYLAFFDVTRRCEDCGTEFVF